ncbi:MAG: acylneuraminate cytidylyltransferase family protein [Chloroflexi bacterium]|nr:acylneuraminate cytidylyltransferase family protein [Chloroflexota bacterium]MCI0727415.1 acylneuraminate cytidylyltransferase family protein [Chloroflexota bacterium]
MRVLGLIPARGGSKGVPRKNIRLLGGRPLLQYTAESALAARRLSRVILSTEDEEIAGVGRRCGLDVPFLRPAELARDDTPALPVIQHALQWLDAQGEQFDAVCFLQPTCPLRRAEDIDACITLLEERNADTVVSVLAVPLQYNPYLIYFENGDGLLQASVGDNVPLVTRRQDLPAAFRRDGTLYVMRRDLIMEQNSLYGPCLVGYPLDPERSVNIDTPEDWERAERLLRSERVF